MTLAVAALAIAAIFMTSSAGLLSRFYDKERLFRLAAESALERTRSRMLSDLGFALADTGMTQLLSGWTPAASDGVPLSGVAVNVYAAVTGDTTGLFLPHITLIAASYDATGTRHVRRMDLQRESFSRYQYFVDSFPTTTSHGPGIVGGRVHSNANWINSASGNRFLDTVTAVGTISGTATFEIDSIVSVIPVPYPKDSTFLRLDTLALNGGLRFAPVSGSGRGTRMEFVAFDADNDGTVEESEGFFKVFDISTVRDTTYLRATPPELSGLISIIPFTMAQYIAFTDPRIQNQCGAFYRRAGRWHFFPIATHRSTWARNLIQENGATDYPSISNGTMNGLDDYDYNAARDVMQLPTARCFPAGSPYLMTVERMTNLAGVVTGTAADSIPFGVVTPPGGWPPSAPTGYGGGETTFTIRSRTCTFSTTGTSGLCNPGTRVDLGTWRAGTNPAGISTSVRQSIESPYLWAFSTAYNANSRRVVSVTGGPIFLSGTVRGKVTLRASGAVHLVDRVTHYTNPHALTGEACADQLGIVAVGDVLVVSGMMNRLRRVGAPGGFPVISTFAEHMGGEGRFAANGAWMSLTGTVGVEHAAVTMGATADQLRCPDDAGTGTRSNGGCLALTGGAIMRTYSSLYSGTATGFRYLGAPDRCQSTNQRPPFFPLTNRFVRVRTLEIEPSLANNPTKIRALLMRLKGQSL